MKRMLALFTLCAATAAANTSTEPKPLITPKATPEPNVVKIKPDHFMNFPKNSLGVLYYRPAGSVRFTDWKPYRKAQGDVPVVRGMVLRLDVNPSQVRNLNALQAIRPEDLQMLNLGGMRVSDEEMLFIKHLTGLRVLNLRQAPITDKGLAVLAGLRNIETLYIEDTKVTDEGMRYLADKTGLVHLDLSENRRIDTPRITDAGLLKLNKLTRIQHLNVAGCDVSDAGLAIVRGMPLLYVLNVARTRVTDAVFDHCAGMTWLSDVNVSETAVTDAGVEALVRQKTPVTLNLSKTRITEASLARLKDLPQLAKLNISGTFNIGESGVAALSGMKALKELTVDTGQLSPDGIAKIKESIAGVKIEEIKKRTIPGTGNP